MRAYARLRARSRYQASGSAKAPGPQQTGRPYTYQTIAELVSAARASERRWGPRGNLYGVVVSWTAALATNGTDHKKTVVLKDLSGDTELVVNFFAHEKELELMPAIQSVGDVMRLHRVGVSMHGQKPVGFAKMAKGNVKNAITSFVLWRTDDDDGRQPYQVSSERYSWHANDAEQLKKVQSWVVKDDAAVAHLAPKEIDSHCVSIEDLTSRKRAQQGLKGADYLDVVVKVLYQERVDYEPSPETQTQTQEEPLMPLGAQHNPAQPQQQLVGQVAQAGQAGPSQVVKMLVQYVWDGTDETPCLYKDEEPLAKTPNGVGKARVDSLSPEVLRTFPLLGSVVPVLWEAVGKHAAEPTHSPPAVGSWVKLRHVKSRVGRGYRRELWLKNFSTINPVIPRLAQDMEDDYSKRVDGAKRQNCSLSCRYSEPPLGKTLTTVYASRRQMPFSSFREVLAATGMTSTMGYRCLARVITVIPTDVVNFCAQAPPPGPGKKRRANVPFEYRIKVQLEDPTGRLWAWLGRSDAERFFQGLPPCDLRSVQGAETAKQLQEAVDLLTGVKELKENDRPLFPWMDLYLCSFYSDKADPWGTRLFAIRDTIFTPPSFATDQGGSPHGRA